MLSKAEKFFVDAHPELSPKQIAEELEISAKSVQAYRKQSPPKQIEATPEPPSKVKNHFVEKEGICIMTEAQSALGDMARQSKKTNPDYDKFKIDPSKPSR